MALLSRAACDIASKTVTGRSPKTLFREIMGLISPPSSSANLRLSRPAPRLRDACRKETRQPAPPATRSPIVCRTGRQTPPLCLSDREWLADRNPTTTHDRARIGIDRYFVGLTHIDQEIAPLGHAARY